MESASELSAFFDDLERRALALARPGEEPHFGATEKEIWEIERNAGRPLPVAYRMFLDRMGGGGNALFLGSDYTPKWVAGPDTWKHAEQLLKESCADYELPCSAFVFLMHQGYIFYWFDLADGDDPPVFSYAEHVPQPRSIDGSLSAFLAGWAEDVEASVADLRDGS